MASIKISALPAVAAALTTDIFPVVQGGITSGETIVQVQTLFGFSAGLLSLSSGGTNANLTASNGGIFYSTATAGAILSGTATANQLLLSGAGAAPIWSTVTHPATTIINQLLYSSSNNVLAGLTTANSSVLVTSAGGIPSLSTALPSGITTTDPTTSQGIATKNYVDNVALGGAEPCFCATTANLNVTQSGAGVGATLTDASGTFAAFTVDGQSPSVGVSGINTRVLVKNQTTQSQNGIYNLTRQGDTISIPYQLTRAIDYDTVTNINDTGLVPVVNGIINSSSAWTNTTTMVSVDTTNITFSKIGNSGTVTSVGSSTGLTGGPITSSGTLSFASIASHSLWANITAGSAVPTVIGTKTFLQQVTSQMFTSNGTYTPTAGMVFCIAEAIGGGGGGGGVASTTFSAGSGGGGGEYTRSIFTAAQIGASQAVTVGAAGNAGAAGNNNGTAGGNTSLGALLIANGGGAGTGSPDGSFANGGGAGGTGGTGTLDIAGGRGDGGFASTTLAWGGPGGTCIYGEKSNLVPIGATSSNAGAAGVGFGSGGRAGASTMALNVAGAAGTAGILFITEFIAI